MEGKEQWGEHTSLGGTTANYPDAGCDFPQPHLLPPACQEVCDLLTGGGWHSELREFRTQLLIVDQLDFVIAVIYYSWSGINRWV